MPSAQSSTLGVFGYLPSHPDFVRVRSSGREVRRFEEWILRGLDQARWDMSGGFSVAYPRLFHRFLFRPDNSQSTVMGLVAASQDNHQRPFPFVAFDLISNHDWEQSPLAVLDDSQAVFTLLESLVVQLGQLSHIGQIHGQVVATQLPCIPHEKRADSHPDEEARFANFLQETTCGELGHRQTGNTLSRGGAPFVCDLIAQLGCGLDLRQIRQSILIPLCRPPFARQLELRFYLALISSLTRQNRPTLTMFWQLGGPLPGQLLISFREPTVDAFSALIHGEGTSRGIYRPGQIPQRPHPQLGDVTDAMSLQELLGRIAQDGALSGPQSLGIYAMNGPRT